jgi:monoterpene epsilon-lactone hydrolase
MGDLKGLPPILMLVGGQEILLSDSINFAEKAKAAGVDVTLDIDEPMFHVYPVFYGVTSESKIALGKIALFIKMKTA